MNETLLDYAINPTPYPIQASPSTGNPNLASLTLVVSSPPHHTITCSKIALSFRIGGNAEDFCSDATGISSSPQTGWSVKQGSGLFTFTPDTKDKGQVGKDGLVFGLSDIKVNQQPGPFCITLDEEASDSDASPPAPDQTRSRSWWLAKFPSQFTVGDLNADPFIVGSGGSTTLSWSGSGSSGNYTALYEIQYVDADGNKVTIDHPKGEPNQPLPPVGGYTVDGLKANPTTFYLLVTVQIQGSNNPLKFARDRPVTVTAPPPPKPTVTSYTGELQPDGSLLLKWTTQPDHGVTVTLNALSSEIFVGNGQFPTPEEPPLKPTLPLLNNDLYALTATLGEKSDRRVFTAWQKFGVLRPAIGGFGDMLPGAIAVSPDSSHVFVTNAEGKNVSIIEVNLSKDPTFRVLPTPVDTGRTPLGIAVSPNGKYVFVANSGDNSVTVFSGTPPFQLVAASVFAGNEANCLAVSPDNRYVFVLNGGSGKLSVIDTVNAPPFNVIQGPALDPNWKRESFAVGGMAISPDGRYLFVSTSSFRQPDSEEINSHLRVVQIKADANPPFQVLPALLLAPIPPNAISRGVAVSPDGHFVFVASCDSDSPSQSSVSVIEVSSTPFKVLSPAVSTGPDAFYLTVSPDGRFLFVTSDNGVLVWVIDKNSNPPVQLLQNLSAGPQPRAVAVSPDARFVFVGTFDGDSGGISVIERAVVSM